jgi:hypothetical protein
MPIQERRERAQTLRDIVCAHDVNEWFRRQLEDAEALLAKKSGAK